MGGQSHPVKSGACVCVAGVMTLFFFVPKEVDNFPTLSILLPSIGLLHKRFIEE